MTDPAFLSRRQCLSALATIPVYAQCSRHTVIANVTDLLDPSSARHSTSNTQNQPGLSVQNGQFHRQGRPIRALGVNYFDCFMQMLSPSVNAYEEAVVRCERGLEQLSRLKIPFIRFNAGGFYPKDWLLYHKDPDAYFQRWDRLIGLAETYNIGLIPSLFWTFFTQPGIAKEPLSAWGDASSQTHRNMRSYVEQIVSRSHKSDAIWAWEFGNEYNLDIDLPNQKMHLKHWYQVGLGMPAEPGELDFLTSDHLRVALDAFSDEVRKHDSTRPVLAGHASPRSSAWNLSQNGGWQKDTDEEWAAALQNQNPPSLSGISIHLYPFHADGSGLAAGAGLQTLQAAASLAKQTRQPLWVGEFGPSPKAEPAERLHQYSEMIRWLEATDVRLAASWVFDYAPQPTHNLASDENRQVLELISSTNQKWHEQV